MENFDWESDHLGLCNTNYPPKYESLCSSRLSLLSDEDYC